MVWKFPSVERERSKKNKSRKDMKDAAIARALLFRYGSFGQKENRQMILFDSEYFDICCSFEKKTVLLIVMVD